MTQTTQANVVQWINLVLVILLIIGGLVYIPNLATNDDVSKAVESIEIPEVDVPTAAEIAVLVNVPTVDVSETTTIFSVKEDKEKLAEDLARKELDDNDFLEWLAEELIDELDGLGITLDEDFDEDNINSISIKDVEVTGIGFDVERDESATVDFVARVYIDDEGDKESVRVEFSIDVDELVYDDDYEDAEVDEDFGDLEITKCYNDFCTL